MIKAVIFDCFGVLYQGSLSHLASLAAPEDRDEVYAISHRSDYGYISHEEYLEATSKLVNLSPEGIKQVCRQQHVRNEPLIAFVRTLRAHHKTALLSNVGRSVMNELFDSAEQADLFDTVVLSSDVGMVKPHREIYELAATRLGLQPSECVMIDDIARNVEGAEAAGMKGMLYVSNEQVAEDLRQLIGVPDA